MGAYKKLILDETSNTLIGKDLDEDDSQNVISRQVKKFDKYSSERVKDLFAEYDRVAINSEDLKNLTCIKTNALEKDKLSFRAKLYIASSSIILSLMLFLAIYNIFIINSLNSGIQALQNNVVAEQNNYNQIVELANTNQQILDEKLKAQGYSYVSDDKIITLELGDVSEIYELQGETNWFNEVCNFLSNLFSGK